MADSFDFAKKIASKAMPEMLKAGIAPTPENYALWYAYVTGRNRQLTQKMDRLRMGEDPLTQDVLQQLYEHYVADEGSSQKIARQTVSAQSVMQDLLRMISAMTSEASQYNTSLESYVRDVTVKYQNTPLQPILRELVLKTSQLRDSGSQMSRKLADTRREVEDLRENLVKITEEAHRDPLTGVANRKSFDVHLKSFADMAGSRDFAFSLLMLDIDHFKDFNDKYGHLVGDEVLKIVARELTSLVKGRDIVSRFGGEEFAVLLPDTPLSGALIVAENLRHSVASRDLAHKDTKVRYGSITVSIGVAEFHVGKDSTVELIKRADEALYRSKKGGRNRVTQESYVQV